jgi:hypothetical protein
LFLQGLRDDPLHPADIHEAKSHGPLTGYLNAGCAIFFGEPQQALRLADEGPGDVAV